MAISDVFLVMFFKMDGLSDGLMDQRVCQANNDTSSFHVHSSLLFFNFFSPRRLQFGICVVTEKMTMASLDEFNMYVQQSINQSNK